MEPGVDWSIEDDAKEKESDELESEHDKKEPAYILKSVLTHHLIAEYGFRQNGDLQSSLHEGHEFYLDDGKDNACDWYNTGNFSIRIFDWYCNFCKF